MNMTNMLSDVAAAFAACVGVVLLYLAWKGRAKPASLVAGWGALFVAVVIASVMRGDRAVAEVLALVASVVVLFLTVPSILGLFGAPSPSKGAVKRRASTAPAPAVRRRSVAIGAAVWTFMLTGPIAGIAAIYAAAAFYGALRSDAPDVIANVGVLSVVAGLFFWATLTTVLLMEPRLLRRTIYGLGAAGAAVAVAFI